MLDTAKLKGEIVAKMFIVNWLKISGLKVQIKKLGKKGKKIRKIKLNKIRKAKRGI